MLKGIAWYIVLGIVVYTIEEFCIGYYLLKRYNFDVNLVFRWIDVYGEILDDPWLEFGAKLKISRKILRLIGNTMYILTWPYGLCVSLYSVVLATKEFEKH